jgi:hypothetical protein
MALGTARERRPAGWVDASEALALWMPAVLREPRE